jgi:hypothetical protein
VISINKGDLVHIPQDVNLWNYYSGSMKLVKTVRPITGVFLYQETAIAYRVFALGRSISVSKRHVYPMEAPC